MTFFEIICISALIAFLLVILTILSKRITKDISDFINKKIDMKLLFEKVFNDTHKHNPTFTPFPQFLPPPIPAQKDIKEVRHLTDCIIASRAIGAQSEKELWKLLSEFALSQYNSIDKKGTEYNPLVTTTYQDKGML